MVSVPLLPPVPRCPIPIAWRKWFIEWPSGMRQASSMVRVPSLTFPALATARVMTLDAFNAKKDFFSSVKLECLQKRKISEGMRQYLHPSL